MENVKAWAFVLRQKQCEETEKICALLATVTRMQGCSIIVSEERMDLDELEMFAQKKADEKRAEGEKETHRKERVAKGRDAGKWGDVKAKIKEVNEFNKKNAQIGTKPVTLWQ